MFLLIPVEAEVYGAMQSRLHYLACFSVPQMLKIVVEALVSRRGICKGKDISLVPEAVFEGLNKKVSKDADSILATYK